MSAATPEATQIVGFRWGPATAFLVLQGRRMVALEIDHPKYPVLHEAIAWARVQGPHPAVRGWVLELPGSIRAVLPFQRKLQPGSFLPVAVSADARGDKPPTLTDKPSFPGRFTVYLPLERGLHLSRQARSLAAPADADALKRALTALAPGGWIMRGEAFGSEGAEPVLAEAAALVAEAQALLQPHAGHSQQPHWLRPPRGALERLGLDAPLVVTNAGVGPDTAAIEADYLDRLDLLPALTALLSPQAPFGDGGTLTIEKTEALWAVDVDGGRSGTPVRIVDLAWDALLPQLRLRHVGGIVLVDMPRLDDRALQARALERFAASAGGEVQVLGFTRGGLLELVRPHARPPLLAMGLPPLI